MRALAAAILCVLAITACLVDRPTDKFSCGTSADCSGGRICQSGYCVVGTPDASNNNCPAGCTSCDNTARTCTMSCTSTTTCGMLSCPNNYTCTINCAGNNACANITCAAQSKCNVACIGDGSCGNITCRNACKCDVTCTGNNACGNMSCPTDDNNGNPCTVGGTSGAACDSSLSGCTKC